MFTTASVISGWFELSWDYMFCSYNFAVLFWHRYGISRWHNCHFSGSWQSLVLYRIITWLAVSDSWAQFLWRQSLQHLADQRIHSWCHYWHRSDFTCGVKFTQCKLALNCHSLRNLTLSYKTVSEHWWLSGCEEDNQKLFYVQQLCMMICRHL